ncbi:DUF3592 domain-containing protein [Lacibacter sediminis]|uniref:DUF3592 domain-containing protein n=1 Tax=Lacibacter sediminis TaxID=2760713 RepID=A0A7G5XC32_9BACT|nr:DUF3592 domain-containing protein [Lacibacter sediminis]QNA43035.1 hypothetical protein H4075_13155 [Lacibacter sediminis]
MKLTEKIIQLRIKLIISIYIILFAGVVSVTRTPDFFSGKITNGVIDTFVTTHVHVKNSSFESQPFPAISFKPANDSIIYYAYADRNFYLRPYRVGDIVKVIYNPQIPGEASLYSFPYYWIGMIELWSGFFVLAFILLIFAKQKVI